MPAVIFHQLDQLRAAAMVAAELEVGLTVRTPPDAAHYGGPAYYKAMLDLVREERPALALRAVLDCGDDGALATAALHDGWRSLCFRGPPKLRRKLEAIAASYDAEVLARAPRALDLLDAADPAAACRTAWSA